MAPSATFKRHANFIAGRLQKPSQEELVLNSEEKRSGRQFDARIAWIFRCRGASEGAFGEGRRPGTAQRDRRFRDVSGGLGARRAEERAIQGRPATSSSESFRPHRPQRKTPAYYPMLKIRPIYY